VLISGFVGHVGNKMHKAFPLLVIKFSLAEEVPTANVKGCHKFEQWQFRIQQYLQHEHYALWEVIEFGDSYVVPVNTIDTTGGDKSGRKLTLTVEDMQRKKNDVKARTTLLLSLPDFMDVEIEQDDLNQKFLISLAPEWLMHTIVWRNRSDLDTMSLDNLYNYLKVYESEVHKKPEQNSQNMAFISSTKHSSENEDGNTASVPTASTNVPTASASIRTLEYYNESYKECSDSLKKKLETLQQEKEGVDGKVAVLLTASKDLDNLIESQRPSHIVESISEDDQNRNSSVSETVASPITSKPFIKFAKPKDSQSDSKTDKKETPKKPPVKYAEQYKKLNMKPNVRGNQRNWNNLKSHQLGPDFVMKKKACFNCGNFNHLANDYRKRVKKNFTPIPVAHKPYRPSQIPVKTHMNDSRPNRTFFNKQAHSYTNRPVHRTSAVISPSKAPWVLTVNRNYSPVNRKFSTGSRNFPTASRKFPTGSTKGITADIGLKGKAVKPSACWFWRPSQNLSNKGPKNNSVSVMFKKYTYIDTQGRLNGCSRHMTGNISYLSDFEPYDRGYVFFGQGGCKITGKETIKMGKLEFKNVYFMKDLKYNLFSVSQICDNKNSVLFIDSECIVLGKDFKLLDDANILLRTPRQHNMYSIDLNNIVLHRDLTCLVAKAYANECMLWHRRLGHLNFKTMNKLVGHNLVRGLPTKCFKNEHTCTACLKGKQHKASLTDDFSRFTWTFFLTTNDETSGILKKFISKIENLKDLRVKIIRRNRTLIEAARTMLADANKTPYELFNGRSPAIGFIKPFGYHVMILNTLDNLGKFKEKGDEGYFIGYSMSSKAFKRTRRVEKNLHVEFLEDNAIEKGAGPNWLYDINFLTKSMNYVPMDARTISTNLSGTKDATSQEVKKDVSSLRYTALPNWAHDALLEFSSRKPQDHCSTEVPEGSGNSNPTASTSNPPADQMETLTVETFIPTVSSPVLSAYSTDSQEPSSDARLISKRVANQEETPSLDNILSLTNRFEDILGGTTNSDESNGNEADISNMETVITASPTSTLRIHKDHPKSQIIGPVDTPIQTKNKSKEVGEQSFIATIHQKTDPALLQFCLFSCFLSQVEPKKVSNALQDPSWVEAMQEELLQFKIQNVWTLVDYLKGVRPIGTKWVLKNKKDERGIVIRNKAMLVAQGHTQEERIDYDEVFARVARIEAIRLFLAYASFMGFTVYQMDVKSAFLYGTIDEEAPRAWYGTLSKYLLKNSFQRGTIDQTLFIKKQRKDFILVQVYMDGIIFGSSNLQLCREFEAIMHDKFQMSVMGDILKKFRYSDVRSSNTPMDKENPWGKDGTGKDVDLHLYRSMIGLLMYLTASRPDIMFVICACARHQVTPKECHFHTVKRIFRYLKGHPKLGLWYPKESPFNLVSFSDSDYGGATQDRKSTTRGCQFMGRRLISWQCKK
nr:hypothetical protein [Tanacetum cinerariifolium]